jgi:hypothetical protein
MSFLRPIQWYHSHVDPIWPDGTFNADRKGHRDTFAWHKKCPDMYVCVIFKLTGKEEGSKLFPKKEEKKTEKQDKWR